MAKIAVRKSDIEGSGAFADGDIGAGDTILLFTGRRVSTDEIDEMLESGELRSDDPLQVRGEEYIILDDIPRSLNHSCEPNAGMRRENELIALRNIQKGEELTYDYATVVGVNNHGWKMRCRCGVAQCRRSIGSVLTLPKERLNFYHTKGALPDFILRQISERLTLR